LIRLPESPPTPKPRLFPPRSPARCDRQILRPHHAPAQSLVMMQPRNHSCQWGRPEFFPPRPSAGPEKPGTEVGRGVCGGAARPRRLRPPCPPRAHLRAGRRTSHRVAVTRSRGWTAPEQPFVSLNQVVMAAAVTRHHDASSDSQSSTPGSQAAWRSRDLGGWPALARRAHRPLDPSPSWSCSRSMWPGRLGPWTTVVIGDLVLREYGHR
jgi:hypothetical protein